MKKLLFLVICITLIVKAYAQVPYCYTGPTPSGLPSQITEDEIFNVAITTAGLNMNSDCASNPGGASIPNRFSDYSSVTPFLLPIGTHTLSLTRGPDCNGAHNSTAGGAVFIDYNQDGDWLDAGERVIVFANTINQSQTVTATFTVPNTASVGLTRMRVMIGENMAGSTQAPCGNYTWGETEDYPIFIGNRKWDYSMGSMLAPDSISFCAQEPVVIKAKVNNVENQPIPGGRVDVFIKSAVPGGTTNLFFNKAFTQTVLNGSSIDVEFPPVLFPKDELLELKYIITHPLDSNKSNDTLVKFVQVYKNPVYKLKSDVVCADSFSTVHIYDKPLPLFHKWTNESIVDTTTYVFTSSSKVGIQVSRGWKCNVVDSISVTVKPLPKLTMARDTVLCNGQNVNLSVSMDLPGFVSWDASVPRSPNYTVNSQNTYSATAVANNGCDNVGFTKVTVVNPPSQPYILDTVCAGETAKLGLDYTGTDFIYKWTGRTETTPLINPTPAITSGTEKYYVQWWYQGCTSRDSVVLKVNPLPSVTLNFPPPICPFFASTIIASGASKYEWRNGLGINSSVMVSPLTTTDYFVKGTDANGCSKEVMHRQFVYPRPDMKVYSNKSKDNVCLGDSATIYVNGGKTYSWSTGATDSILKVIPTQSFQWSMIGTDKNGCKDTLSYRLNVKPAFSITYDKTMKGCEGEVVTLRASGSKEYDWGQGPTSDSFNTVTLINSTSYQVTATSPYECQIVASIPVTVYKKPVGQLSDLTICKGETGTLEAKGGIKYDWTINSQTIVTPNGNLGTYTHTDTATISVQVENEAGCKDTAWTTVNVINTDLAEVIFKSPLDSYNCASPKIPITLSATPVGGVWSGGSYVNGNKLSPAGLNGNVQVLYTYFEPINNCKVERIKTVKFKCTSGISGFDNYDDFTVYPMPFSDKITVKYTSDKAEEASVYIYDLSGREVYHYSHRLLPGENMIDLRQLQLAKGTYYLDFQTESVNRQAKILAQ